MSGKTKMALKKNKKGIIFNPDTGLVVKSSSERIVIGKLVDEEFVSLTKEVAEYCEKNQIEYDKTLLKETSSQEEQEEEQNEEQDEEENQENEEEEEKREDEVKKQGENRKKSEEIKKKSISVEKPVSKERESKITEQTETGFAHFNSLLKSFQTLFEDKDKNLNDSKKVIIKLESQVAELTENLNKTEKQLEETKKRLKGVLLAMQGEL